MRSNSSINSLHVLCGWINDGLAQVIVANICCWWLMFLQPESWKSYSGFIETLRTTHTNAAKSRWSDKVVIRLQTYIVLWWGLYVSSCIYLRFTLFLTYLLFVADTVLKPQIKNKKTVSRPAEKDFKTTNVSIRCPFFISRQDFKTPGRWGSFRCQLALTLSRQVVKRVLHAVL